MHSVDSPLAEVRTDSEDPVGRDRQRLLERWLPTVIGVLVASGTVFPLTRGGWFLTLDWVHGPYLKEPAGFGYSAVNQVGLPVTEVVSAAGWVLGGATVSWLIVAASIVVAAAAAGALVPAGPLGRSIAALFYCLNPFVWDRINAGQMYVLLGYAVLPLVARALLCSSTRQGWARWTGAVWLSLDGAISVHFLWIGGVLLLATVAWRRDRRTMIWAAGTLILLVVLDAYLVLPEALQKVTLAVSSNDLVAFRTAADPRFGLYLNVAGLYGFWRVVPFLPKADVAVWPVLAVAFVLLATKGLVDAQRRNRADVAPAVIGTSAVLGYFLALGDQGPTGTLFRSLYHYLPGFNVMREPEKFSALLALGLAVGLGLAVDSLQLGMHRTAHRLSTGLAVAAIVAYTPTMFWGLDGHLSVSHFPSDWSSVNRIMGKGPGRVLVLPLHDYVGFSFTGGRIIANPAPEVFNRRSLIGGEIQAGPLQTDSLSPEDAYLDHLVSNGPKLTSLGHLVAQLGIRYVVLFKTADYPLYGWLGRQTDLRLLYSSSDISLYENPWALPAGARLAQTTTVPSVACYIKEAQTQNLSRVAVVLRTGVPCGNGGGGSGAPHSSLDVRRSSATSYSVAPAKYGGTVVVPQPADGTWTDPGHRAVTLADGVQGFAVGPDATTVVYRRWWAPLVGDAVSGSALLVLLVGWGVARRQAGGPTS